MAYVDKINVQGTDYDINDKRLPESSNVIEVAKDLKMGSGKLAKLFEDITDADGNKRFISGDLEYLDSGVASVNHYAKWSLSGTHLMVVLAFDVDNGVAIGGNYNNLGVALLPQYINDKIVGFSGGVWLEYKTGIKGFDANANELTQTINVGLRKLNEGLGIEWGNNGAITFTEKGTFRLVYDLLIDAE